MVDKAGHRIMVDTAIERALDDSDISMEPFGKFDFLESLKEEIDKKIVRVQLEKYSVVYDFIREQDGRLPDELILELKRVTDDYFKEVQGEQ